MGTEYRVLFSILLLSFVFPAFAAPLPEHLKQMHVPDAWVLSEGDSKTKVAVIDTGLNYSLASFAEVVSINEGEYGQGKETNLVDDDNNGYVDDVIGVNTLLGSNDPRDLNGHGTAISSLIGAQAVFTSQIQGVFKKGSLVVAAALNEGGYGTYVSLVKAIRYVMGRGSRIVFLGLGSGRRSKYLCNTIATAEKEGVLFVVPAGAEGLNLDKEGKSYPTMCRASNIISVASLNENAEDLSSFTNYGTRYVHVAAPGMDFPVYEKDGQEIKMSGTSLSAALVAGVASLVLSKNPALNVRELKSILIAASDPLPAIQGKVRSGGILNAYKAVNMVEPKQVDDPSLNKADPEKRGGVDVKLHLFDPERPQL